ncbi:gastric triacylglycerol lipase-like [Anthonomus grandis grandis]|uniref:gastric triacylglycerol lipase-like n=1 Tax=Anthonomus grandis grandis TaxID=2921223 RepID=UPI002166BD47|nr:gastric triacylglycerol lipase-like [Anthonomus grandis grandis]
MGWIWCVWVFVCSGFYALALHPEVYLNMEQRVKRHGYPLEIHPVTTEDGYILNMYRIPHGLKKSENEPTNKSAILLVHSSGGSPANFVTLGKKYSAAYYFADRGFDVWLFCSRGTECQNPRKHIKWDWNNDPEYWNWSFHEVGLYDLPASIDHILNVTQQKKIFHVGYSSGGPQLYALISEKPEYNEKIKLNVNYAAAVLLKEVDYPFLQVLCQLSNLFKNLYGAMGVTELTPPVFYSVLSDLVRKMCADPKWFRLCKVALSSFGSNLSTLMEDDIVELATSVFPRLSVKQATHYMDNVNRGDFRKYDYGKQTNLAVYGRAVPPRYNLTATTVPNAFFYGATDSLSVPEDNQELIGILSNVIYEEELGPSFVHLDFIFAKNASHMLYKPTVKLFKDFDAGRIPPKIVKRSKQ